MARPFVVRVGDLLREPGSRRPFDISVDADRIETEGLRALEPGSMPGILPEALRHDERAYLAARARWLANDPRSFAAIYRMFAHLDMAPDYPQIQTPCLLIGATHDGLRPPAAVKAHAS